MRNCSSKSSNAFSWKLSAHQLHPQSPEFFFSWAQLLIVCLGRSLWWYLWDAEQWCSKKKKKKRKTLSASDAGVRHRCLNVAASASHFIVTGVIYFRILKMFQYIFFQILPLNPQVQKSLQTWGHRQVRARKEHLQRGCQHPLRCADTGIQKPAQHPAVCPSSGLWWCQSGTHHLKEALLGLELFPLCLWSSLVPRIISRASSI